MKVLEMDSVLFFLNDRGAEDRFHGMPDKRDVSHGQQPVTESGLWPAQRLEVAWQVR